MYDREIRAALCEPLEAAGVRVVHEWAVGGSVVDVAAITDRLHAYEVKGPRDSLTRLAGQVADYSKVFDRCTLVGSVDHVDKATEKGIIPDWWGTAIAIPERLTFSGQKGRNLQLDSPDAGVKIVRVREAQQNPKQQPTSLAWVLYSRELKALCQRHCLPYRSPKTTYWSGLHGKPQMIRTVTASLSLDELRVDVVRFLLAREEWKADGHRTGRPITRKIPDVLRADIRRTSA